MTTTAASTAASGPPSDGAAIRSLAEVPTLVEPAIRAALDRLDSRNRLVAGYQFGFWDPAGHPTRAGGKGLRPALALLSARGASAPAEVAVPAAVAVELAHNFSLLHDDVMDGDTERRHRPTAWAVFGAGPAILAGDALLLLAQEALDRAPSGAATTAASARFRADLQRLIAGQAADLDLERREQVSLDECLQMAADKTAALLSCACALGALLSRAPQDLVAGLSRFGARLGLAFQLIDDLLGIWGDPRRTGKPVGADLRVRKRSIPVVRAATSGTAAGRELAALYRAPGPLTDEDVAHASRLVEDSGARAWTRAQADAELAAGLAELAALPLPETVGRELADLAAFVTGRDY